MCRIARELNRRGIRFRPGAKWRSSAVYAILTQQKYVGTYEFGRTSSRLYTPLIKLPKSDWILARRAFEPLIDYPTFAQAQQIVYQRTINKSNEELLVGLKGLLGRCGTLSGTLITAESNIPSPTTYRKRFGSLRKAYGLIRYVRSEDFGATELRRRTQALRDEVIDKLAILFPQRLSIVCRGGKWRRQLRLQTGELVSVLIMRRVYTKVEAIGWLLRPVQRESNNITLLARYDRENRSLMDLHLVRNGDRHGRVYLRQTDEWFDRGVRLAGLSDLMAAMKAVSEKRIELT